MNHLKFFSDHDLQSPKSIKAATSASAGHNRDEYNAAIIKADPRLQSILAAYQRLDDAGRDQLAQRAAELRNKSAD